MTVICRGPKITTFVNNILASVYDGTGFLNDEAYLKYHVGMNGHIALQLHMRNEKKIRFKEIESQE